MDANDYSSSSESSSSDEEDIINFIVLLGQPRRIPRFHNRNDHFNYWDDSDFYRRFRLSKETVVILLQQIQDRIKSPTDWNHALNPMEMLLITLRYLATGSFLIVVGDFGGIHKSTTSKLIFRVIRAIANLRNRYVLFPETEDEINTIQVGFFNIARFPRVVGAVDCTHVKILSPGGDQAEIYRNRKNFFSINVQTICDSQLKIRNIVARWPGSAHDSTIFNQSQICAQFENGHFGNALLVGDAGYAVKNYLLTPLAHTNNRAENLYNESLIRTRNCVERSYGVWKKRFPVLSNGINLQLRKAQWVIVAAAVLHNLAIEANELEPPELNEEDEVAFNFANNMPQLVNANANQNNYIRNQIISYFRNL